MTILNLIGTGGQTDGQDHGLSKADALTKNVRDDNLESDEDPLADSLFELSEE